MILMMHPSQLSQACSYLRSITDTESTAVNLLYSKTRGAPIKRLNIPRCDHCKDHLLLTRKVLDSIKIMFEDIYLWCDSTVTIALIRISPQLLNISISNSALKSAKRFHVSGIANPDD